MQALPTAMSRPARPVARATAPNRLFHATALLIALWLGVASPVRASNNEPLVLAAAVQAALARSQALSAQDAAARSAREAAVAAGQRPDPVLRFSLNSLPIEGDNRFSTSAEPMTSKAVSLMQAFPAESKRQARSLRFEREADVALATRAQRAASLRRDTAIAWFERHAQEQRVSLLRAQLSENRLQLQAAEAATRGALPAGTNSPSVDWLNARDAVAQTQQALLGAEAGLVNARQALARWTGESPDRPLGDAPALTPLALSATGFAPHLQQHPDLALASARLATAEADAELARQDRQPDWSGELMFSHRRPRFDNMVSLAVSVPLQWDRPQRQDRVLAARLARVDELQAEREERSREALAETERWLAAWRAGLEQMALIDSERLPWARQRVDLAQAAYRGSNARLGDVLAARRMALALEMERIEVHLSTARLWARLAYLLPDVLSTDAARLALTATATPKD
ncbi:TolC family protein [Hydrogenophaga taeniospiralis]|uniref:TolC family protein n=1 Tax=Hydrogenophaga taeniospiralis TaxID=65656 RepID=UPI001CFC26C2|nr:TolC family protein [Hydrogenophaga taeniospiralis]UCU93460.1 TolC family protein [Hydrogenophaga taeniospiralis]